MATLSDGSVIDQMLVAQTVTISGCDRVALGVQVVSSFKAHHLWRVWKTYLEENVESDVHRPRQGGVRQRISPSKSPKNAYHAAPSHSVP